MSTPFRLVPPASCASRTPLPTAAADPAALPPPAISLRLALLVLAAAAGGAGAASVVLPAWFPALATSLLGSSPKAYWYLSRSSAFVAFGLLWLSMLLGLSLTSKLSRLWPGAPTTYDLHQFASLLGLAFAIFHAGILLGDRYVQYTLAALLVPFASAGYRPLWVGVGQVAFYLSLLVAMSFYVRRAIGQRTWRLLHFLSFLCFALALLHGITSGTDSGATPVRFLYWGAGGSVLFLTNLRLVAAQLVRVRLATALRVSAQPARAAA